LNAIFLFVTALFADRGPRTAVKASASKTMLWPYESPALAIGDSSRNLQWKSVFKYPDDQSSADSGRRPLGHVLWQKTACRRESENGYCSLCCASGIL